MTKTRPKPSRTRTSSRPKVGPRWPLWLTGVVVLTFVTYLPSLRNGFTNWDDDVYVTENPLLAHPGPGAVLTTPVGSNYHPLTIWSLALNYRLAGTRPESYHWLNLILHVANTALVFWFVRTLSGGRLWTTVGTSLLFGIHPMHVESVAWVAERKDVLYTLFYLVGLISYLRYLDTRSLTAFLVTLLAFVLSLASKPAAIVFPLTLLALDAFRKRSLGPRLVLEKLPLFALSGFTAILTLQAQKAGGAMADPHTWKLLDKLAFASYGCLMYVAKLFVPIHLSAVYPYPNVEGKGIGWEFYAALGLVVVALPTILMLCRRVPVVLFGIAFFLINIVLVLQFVTVGQAVMADRYTYLPYVGLLLALTWWLDLRPGLTAPPLVRATIAAAVMLLVPVCLVATWQRCKVWHDAETLWTDTIQKYPRRIVDAYNNRGYYYRHAGRLDEAMADYNQALRLNPRYALVWANKGNVFFDLNRNDSALVCYDRALALQPGLSEPLNNRGAVRARLGDVRGAVADFTKAIAADPSSRDGYSNRGLAYEVLNDYEKAIADDRRVIELDPRNRLNHVYHDAIGTLLQKLGRYREAVEAYNEAIRTAPNDQRGTYYLHRSQGWHAQGDANKALRDAQEAMKAGIAVDASYIRSLGG